MKESEAWEWTYQHIKNRQEGEETFGRFYIRLHDFGEIPEALKPTALDWERWADFAKQREEDLKKPIHFGYAVGTFKQWCGAGSFAFKDTEEEATAHIIEEIQRCLRQVYRDEETCQQNLVF